MDWHIELAEELFSAARPSSSISSISTSTTASMSGSGRRTAGATTSRSRPGTCCTPIVRLRLIFVGDASMSPYEIAMPGGSVEHWNEEAGEVWMERLATVPEIGLAQPGAAEPLELHQSIRQIGGLMGRRMFR
jgi:uncharacterized protein with von Willebrand factor type A (vWA) domain